MKKVILGMFILGSLSFANTMKGGYLFTVTKPQLKKAISLSGDREAWLSYATMLSNNQQAGITKDGIQVEIVDFGFGMSEFRIKGEYQTYWVNTEAVAN